MSAPEVGDRVRVIAGQWVGWEGVALEDMGDGWWWLKVSVNPSGRSGDWQRPVHETYLHKVPATPVDAPRSHETGADVETDAGTLRGAQRGAS